MLIYCYQEGEFLQSSYNWLDLTFNLTQLQPIQEESFLFMYDSSMCTQVWTPHVCLVAEVFKGGF